MEQYFNINYEFDKQSVFFSIDRQLQTSSPGYICVADGVILNTANRKPDYLEVVNGSMFSICDSSRFICAGSMELSGNSIAEVKSLWTSSGRKSTGCFSWELHRALCKGLAIIFHRLTNVSMG